MKRYPLWLLLGVLSGFLWGCNNYLYAVGAHGAAAYCLQGVSFRLFVQRSMM